MAKKNILIVDDEDNFTKLVKLNLEATGNFEVMVLSGPKDLLTSLRHFKPDLILLDLLMPGTGGLEVCDILNDDEFGRKVPVIILSALDKMADKSNAYKKGAVDYLVKPIETEELISRIDRVLQSRYG
ncbi:MAG: response regulator [Candidatus Omnitrophica bacterium]|jgi:DNA-binding response OmpR family regulator|nr:response regulator [Candidatus Omnitrophota bacterium]